MSEASFRREKMCSVHLNHARMTTAINILLVGLLGVHVSANSTNKASTTAVKTYMGLSGFNELVDSIPGQITAIQNHKQLTTESSDKDKQTIQLISDAWNADQATITISNYIQSHSTAEEMERLVAWKQTALVVKITEAEIEASLPDFQSEFLRYIADLQVAPPLPERRAAIKRLVESTDMAKMMVEMTIQVTETMTRAFMVSGSFKGSKSEADAIIKKQSDAMRASITPSMEQQSILISYYVYRDISNAELDRYSSFYDSALGKRDLALEYGASNSSISEWAETSAKAIIQEQMESD